MTVHEVLVEALDLIERVDWIQGRKRRQWWRRIFIGDGVCGLGAVEQVVPGDLCGPLGTACITALSRAAGRHLPLFNDDDGRTKEDVVCVFRAAIEATKPRRLPILEEVIEMIPPYSPRDGWQDLVAVR